MIRSPVGRRALDFEGRAVDTPSIDASASADGATLAPSRARPRNGMRTFTRAVAMTMATTAILAVFLLVVGPRLLPYRVVPVLGGSMAPTIRLGSLAVMRPVAATDVRVGDIIIFGRSDGSPVLVTHRVVAIRRMSHGPDFLTKGDANGARDGWYVPAVGSGWRYSFSVPGLGFLIGNLGSGSARRAVGIVLLLALVVWILDGIWLPKPKSKPVPDIG